MSKVLLAVWVITTIGFFIIGYYLGSNSNVSQDDKEDTVTVQDELPKSEKNGTIKEIIYRNKTGELFCPPPQNRRCIIVPTSKFMNSIPKNNSCSDIEDELLDLEERYDSMKKFCDPACPEYLDRTSRELLSCMRDLQAVTGSSRYNDSIYFP